MNQLETREEPSNPASLPENTITPLDKVWSAAGPYVEKVAQAAIDALERSARHSGVVTGLLLALIIVVLGGLAAYSMGLGRIDTAEKIIIALVSFLGGAAMFSGPPRK